MKRKTRKRAPKPKSVDGRKRLSPKEIAALAKQIEAGDHAPSYDRMRLACEARNWDFLESCAIEHIALAPECTRPYIYRGIALAFLDRESESRATISTGYDTCPRASSFMREMAFVQGVLGHNDSSLHFFILSKFLAAGKGDGKGKVIRLGKDFHRFLETNRLGNDRRG